MKDFLLKSDTAKMLYSTVEKLPIIDYHNHLSVADISENKRFSDIYELWIKPDPYKHRAMRILGVEEKYITGDGSDYEKFCKWYECLPLLSGNVLYHWSDMELDRFFGIDLTSELDNGTTSQQMWNLLNEKVSRLTPKDIIGVFNVEYLSPCATFGEDISVYDGLDKICPSLRGDDGTNVTLKTVETLGVLTGEKITSLTQYINALEKRIVDFKTSGCRFSDHAVDDGFMFFFDDGKNDGRFKTVLSGKMLDSEDSAKLYCYVLTKLCCLYEKHGITVQLHMGALRKTSTRLKNVAGPAGGYAAMGSGVDAQSLTQLLDCIEKENGVLPKIILFNLNPSDNAMMDILCGSFSRDGMQSVVTRGPAWWWCDHHKGIKEMLDSFSYYSVLSTFIGMTTDSRSLLSLVRHDYFRRVLCSYIEEKVQDGTLPDSEKILSEIVRKMCYENALNLIK